MDADREIASWVIDFLTWQPMEAQHFTSVIRSLPLPNEAPRLQKSLLLRTLASDASRPSISETTLESLEMLEEIEFRRGNLAVSDAMKRAYCLAAVDCTMKLLATGDGSDAERKSNFSEIVARLWRGKIGRIEEAAAREGGGLGSDLLWEWRGDIEAAVSDDGARERALRKYEGVRAADAVEDYVREERERMGPSFLERVAERLRRDVCLQNILGVNGDYQVAGEVIDLVGEEEAPPSDQ